MIDALLHNIKGDYMIWIIEKEPLHWNMQRY